MSPEQHEMTRAAWGPVREGSPSNRVDSAKIPDCKLGARESTLVTPKSRVSRDSRGFGNCRALTSRASVRTGTAGPPVWLVPGTGCSTLHARSTL